MNATVEAFAFLLGFIAWLMVGVALPNRNWKVSTVDGNVITTSTIYENLWMSCATDSTGVHNCRDFPSLLALNGMWPTARMARLFVADVGTVLCHNCVFTASNMAGLHAAFKQTTEGTDFTFRAVVSLETNCLQFECWHKCNFYLGEISFKRPVAIKP